MILAGVACERVLAAVERESSAADAIGISPDERSEIALVLLVLGQRVVAERDVGQHAGAVGDEDRLDDAAERQRGDRDPARRGEREPLDGTAVRRGTERLASHATRRDGRAGIRGSSGHDALSVKAYVRSA